MMYCTRKLVLGVLVSLSMLSGLAHAAHVDENEAASFRVGFDLWPGYYPLVLAKQRGIYSKMGLSVNYQVPENTDAMIIDFLNGRLDAICVSLGDVLAILKKMPDARVVMVADTSSGGDALLSLKALPSTMDGKKVGTNLGGFGELFVQVFLERNGFDKDAVDIVNVEASLAFEDLYTGKVDVVHTWEPYVSEAVSSGARIVFSSEQTPGLIPDVLIVSGAAIKARYTDVQNFIDGWLESAQWWISNRSEGDKILEQELLLLPGSISLKGIELFTLSHNEEVFNQSNVERSLYSVADQYIDFFIKKGVLDTVLPATSVIDGQFIHSLSDTVSQ